MAKNLSNCSDYGKLMLLVGTMISVPLLVLPFYPEDARYALSFIIPALFSIFSGIIVCRLGKKGGTDTTARQSAMQRSSLTVLFAWSWGIVTGAAPFVLARQMSVVQALFESVSGWTTTGLSVMDVSTVPKIFLFHRSFMQFCGGLGFVLMMIMLISGKQSMSLFSAEGHPDKLMPNLKKTARTIFIMYSGFLVIGTVSYCFAGMSLFESICHAMCSLSTGGFSTRLGSIGEYNSLPVEIITIILMLIGTTNFAVLLLLTKRKWKQAFRVSEVRFMIGLLLIFVPLTAFSLSGSLNIPIAEGFHKSFFDVSSALSTTGYSSMSYTGWPAFSIGILILMMLVGGGMGSTAGGMKMTRVYLMLRLAAANVRKRLSPARRIETPYYMKAQGKTPIDSGLAADTTGFTVCYLGLFLIGTFLLTLTADCSLTEAAFEFASALGTVGLSIGLTGPGTNTATLVIEMSGMILGRLEIFIVVTGIVSGIKMFHRFMPYHPEVHR